MASLAEAVEGNLAGPSAIPVAPRHPIHEGRLEVDQAVEARSFHADYSYLEAAVAVEVAAWYVIAEGGAEGVGRVYRPLGNPYSKCLTLDVGFAGTQGA